MNALVTNGTIVTASGRFAADLRVVGGRVAEVAARLDTRPDELVVDARDRLVLPGGVDVHTHLDMPSGGVVTADDFASGTRAAAIGGTTTIIDFANPARGQSLLETLEAWQRRADGAAVVDYGFHMTLVEYDERVAAELPEVVARGVTSFKTFLAYSQLRMDDRQLLDVLAHARRLGALVTVHAENGDMLVWLAERLAAEGRTAPRYHEEMHPAIAEAEATGRAIALATLVGQALYVVHVSASGAVDAIRRARAAGAVVFCETCPQYLLLDAGLYHQEGLTPARWVMSPPLRGAADREALWAGLTDGTVACVATDHCSFDFATQKVLGGEDFRRIPNGIPGIGDRFTLLWTAGVHAGRLTPERFVEVVATNPARLFGLAGRKGSLDVGADGDIVVFDPAREGLVSARTSAHRCDYSAFEGFRLVGMPEVVLARGEVVARDGAYVGAPGRGRYLSRALFAPAAGGRA